MIATSEVEVGPVTTLEGCLARQADRRHMGVVAYDRRSESSSFADILGNLTLGEKAKLWAGGMALALMGGLGVLALWFGARQMVGLIFRLSA